MKTVVTVLMVWLVLSVPVGIVASKVLKARRVQMELEAQARQELQELQARQVRPVP